MPSPTRTDFHASAVRTFCHCLEEFKKTQTKNFSNIIDSIKQGHSLEAIELTFQISNRAKLSDVLSSYQHVADNLPRRHEVLRLAIQERFAYEAVLEALKENDSEILDYFNQSASVQPRSIAEASGNDPEVKEFFRSYKPRTIGQPRR